MAELHWTLARAAAALGLTERFGDQPLRQIVTDSRQAGPGDLFVALRGENHDGHRFVPAAVAAGAAAVLVSAAVEAGDAAVLQVPDTLLAYGALGHWWRQQHKAEVIAITGSTGKTSCRQLTAGVTATTLRTLASPSSYNNEIGLPATLLQLKGEHQVAVLEMAMRGPGQIQYLAELARPRIGLITNIGTSHLGVLGSREAIAQAKGELLDELGPQGIAVLWAEDPFLPTQAPRHAGRVVWYGFQKPADVRATDIELRGLAGSRFRLQTPRGSVAVELPLPGRHMVLNALAAAAVGLVLGIDLAAVAAGLGGVGALPLRLEVVQLRSGARVINDSYNAAPDSVRAALQVLQSEHCRGRRVACLGDIRELGDLARAEHLRLGAEVAAVADVVIGVGELGGEIAAGARDRGQPAVYQVADPAEAGALLASLLQPADLVLLKASRAVGLDRALEALERAT